MFQKWQSDTIGHFGNFDVLTHDLLHDPPHLCAGLLLNNTSCNKTYENFVSHCHNFNFSKTMSEVTEDKRIAAGRNSKGEFIRKASSFRDWITGK